MAHLVVVNATDFDDINATVTLATEGQMVKKNFTLVPYENPIVDGIFSGKVNNTDGVNLSGIGIVIWQEWIELVNVSGNMTNVTMYKYFNVTTDAGGNFTSAKLLLGKYMWEINATGYEVQSGDFELTAIANMVQQNIELVPIVLPPTKFTLTVTVTPADATVAVDGTAATVLNGTAVVTNLAAGEHTIVVAKAGYDTVTKTVNLTADHTEPITLVKTTYSVTVVFKDKKGKALEGAEISFTYLAVPYSGTTDVNGSVTFVNFPESSLPASINITVKYKDKTYTVKSDDVSAGTATVDVESGSKDKDSNVLLYVIIAVVVVIIIVVIIFVMKGKKKEPEVPPELEEEGEELEEGEDMAQDKEAVE
jgi:hypothetical protein